MKNNFLLIFALIFVLGISNLYGQLKIKDTFFETTGVSNNGEVSGYETWAGPYILWNPDNNSTSEIGGVAPGNGVGGRAHFSADNQFISGTSITQMPVSTAWNRNVLADYPYIFKSVEFPSDQNQIGYIAGQSLTYNGNGIVLRTTNGGTSWSPMWQDDQQRGLEAASFPSTFIGYVGGWNHYFAKTSNGGWDWEEMNPAGSDEVYYYTSIEFKDELTGVVAAQLNDGFGVYYTSDGGITWSTSTGTVGIASKVVYAGGNTFYLTTTDGKVQKSINNGQSWLTVLEFPGIYFLGANFLNETTGYALAETYIYKTTDGGANWTELQVSPGLTDGVLWRDVNWLDENNLIITGTPDVIFESDNGGNTWTWANQDIFNGEPALYNIAITDQAAFICGSQGNIYNKSLISSLDIAEMSLYNTSTQQWSALGSLGFVVENSTSSGYSVSGDGNTVVGNSWVSSPETHAHAVAWNEAEGVIDLGTLFAGRSTRAEAVSFDGSVIAGYQDQNGPWKSAVWRKNPAGGYFPNQYLLIDPNGSATDEMNQLGQASAVSSDGNWIGGYGDYAFNNPWIWSEATGLIDLGTIGMPEGAIGHVSGINHDGSVVVGWYVYSPDPWTQEYAPFIWTQGMGAQNLNTFITETLGYTMDRSPIWNANGISENGRYIIGWGLDPTIGDWGELFTFRLDISDWLQNNTNEKATEVTINPNPASDVLNIHSSNQINKIEIVDITGRVLLRKNVNCKEYSTDISCLENGVYVVNIVAGGKLTTMKIIKN